MKTDSTTAATETVTTVQPQLALNVKRVRKQVRTGVQGGAPKPCPCESCSNICWNC